MLNGIDKILLNKVKKTIEKYDMFAKINKAVIGFSAGPDSVCLLDILKKIFKERIKFYLVYINHGLRPKKILQKEEKFIEYYANFYGCDYKIIKIRVVKNKNGLEASAREKRYRALLEYMKSVNAQCIVLAHNLDDFVETFFLNLIRGSGQIGLKSIPAKRSQFVRPLINIKKSEILEYLKYNKLKYSFDITNLNLDIRRNYIRKKIIPHLLKLNPRLYEVIKRDIEILQMDDDLLQPKAEKIFKKVARKERHGYTLDLKQIMYYNKAIGNRVIIQVLKSIKGDFSGFGYKHIDAIWRLNGRCSGKRINLPNGLYAQKVYEKIFIGPISEAKKEFCIPVKIGTELTFKNLKLRTELVNKFDLNRRTANIELFDFDSVTLPLVLRSRKPGDFLKIKAGVKKLKKVLNEARVPSYERDMTGLLCDGHGILWVIGVARAYRAFINKNTKNILKVEFEYFN